VLHLPQKLKTPRLAIEACTTNAPVGSIAYTQLTKMTLESKEHVELEGILKCYLL
jgi:hypothetical protein